MSTCKSIQPKSRKGETNPLMIINPETRLLHPWPRKMSCGAAPIQGEGGPVTSAAQPSAQQKPRSRHLAMQGRQDRLVARMVNRLGSRSFGVPYSYESICLIIGVYFLWLLQTAWLYYPCNQNRERQARYYRSRLPLSQLSLRHRGKTSALEDGTRLRTP
jgi:hypothetical protein